MTRRCLAVLCVAAFVSGSGLSARAGDDVRIRDVKVTGRIQGDDFAFDLSLSATANRVGAESAIVSGDAVLLDVPTGDEWRIRYDAAKRAYVLVVLGGEAAVNVKASFVAKSAPEKGNPYWHSSTVAIPAARVRTVEVTADKQDMELKLPGTLQQKQESQGEKVVATGVLRPDVPLQVRWKAHIETVEAELLVASQANTIVTLSPGALRADCLYTYEISQGKLQELHFAVPPTLSVTQVRGEFVRDWHMEKADDANNLVVRLNREQEKQYRLQVLAESVLPQFPADAPVPVIQPLDGTRADGFLAIGTNSAIQLQVKQSTGLSQVDASAFPRATLAKDQARAIPQSKAFYYSFAATPYQMQVSLADIVPSFDADERLLITVKDDDMTVSGEVDLEVRDAPIRRVDIAVPAVFVVAAVVGQQVGDYSVTEAAEGAETKTLTVEFKQPVLGRTLIQFKLETGRSPIGATHTIGGLSLTGARSERGFIAIVSDQGVLIDDPTAEGLRQVHTRSIPMRVPDAQFAWRFRERGWSLTLPVEERPASIRAEAFHLLSIGDGIAYGSVAFTYVVAGAPVDELQFRVAEELEDVEFVGLDVSRWSQEDDLWTVKLRRKIIGDYNLGITFSQRHEDGGDVLAGAIVPEGVETATGFLTVASHLNLQLSETEAAPALIPIGPEETPSQYRLLVSAPILRSYKYVTEPYQLRLQVQAHERGATPLVMVEFINARTSLSLDEQGNAESLTRVRYTVKNSSAQYLDMAVPEDVKIWNTRLIEKNSKGQERAVRASASVDDSILKIPLKRRRNPNEPLTVELEYGQVHGRLGWDGDVRLALPACMVRSTYADWRVKVQDGWVLLPDGGGSMGSTGQEAPRLLSVGHHLWRGWARAFSGAGPCVVTLLMALAVVIALVLRRPRVAAGVILALLVMLIIQGARAYDYSGQLWRGAAPPTVAAFTQVLDLDETAPVNVALRAVPSWRRFLSIPLTCLLALVAIASFAQAIRKRTARSLLIGVGLASVVLVSVQTDAGAKLAAHLLTWGIPALFLARLIAGTIVKGRAPRPAPAAGAALIAGLCFLALPGTTQAKPVAKPPATPPPVIDRVECGLTVQEDSVLTDLRLVVDTEDGALVPIASSSVLLMAAPDSGPAKIVTEGANHALEVLAGRHEVTVQLLLPLPDKQDDQLRSLTVPLPSALTNQIALTIPQSDLDVKMPDAVSMKTSEENGTTRVSAILAPARPLSVTWKPRGRRTEFEKTVFYAEITGLSRADSGLIETAHRIDLRIAQGELTRLEVAVPNDMTVIRVEGQHVASWRFDPASHRLHVGLGQPVSGDYALGVVTQIAATAMPYTATIGCLEVQEALRQRGSLGLVTSSAVILNVQTHPQPMNVDDYRRAAASLLKNVQGASDVLHAYRLSDPKAAVAVEVTAVTPELRAVEQSSFSVADERLVYNGIFQLRIEKAGVFNVDLELPEGYDVDSLTCGGLSHWDETEEDDSRLARIHFQNKLMGSTTVNVALSRAITELPPVIDVPRVGVIGVLKHEGQVVVSAERGVRLSVAERDGVSELDVATLGLRTKPALAFKLLRPAWALRLQSEVLVPRVNVEFLHLGNVSDGLVRHRYFLRYRLQNAGAKIFDIQIPPDALGLLISGPEIARKELIDADTGLWRVELAGKWFDRDYPMELNYETRFAPETGDVPILPVKAVGADLQRGYIAVRTSPRVELVGATIGASLQVAEARSVPSKFGAGELADAAFCYTSATPDYDLAFNAARHDAAALLQAEVVQAQVVSVVSRQRDTIHQATLTIRAGGKRHLQAHLPEGSQIWSLLVDRQSRTPSFMQDANGKETLLIPLPQTTDRELTVAVDLIYVLPRSAFGSTRKHLYQGPRFDLPLRNIAWTFYVPEGYRYSNLEGTLVADQNYADEPHVSQYDIAAYETETARVNSADLQKAVQLQEQGLNLARRGNQKAARQALEQAFNYSMSDKSLNEDARVNLRNLLRQQAMVGLVGRRGDVRQREQQVKGPSLGESFTQEEAERLQSSLSKSDSENLELITNRMIEMQEAAAGVTVQLMVKAPLHGRVLVFRRPLQVEPYSEMRVSFAATRQMAWGGAKGWLWALVFALVFAVVFAVPPRLLTSWAALCEYRKKINEERAAAKAATQARMKEAEEAAAKEAAERLAAEASSPAEPEEAPAEPDQAVDESHEADEPADGDDEDNR